MSTYTLYGSKISLFTGKARAYLRYKGIPYQEQASTLSVYKKIIIPKTGVRFIPVVKTPDDHYLQDTAVIIDELEKQFPSREILPRTAKQLLVAKLFEWYGDDWLVIPAMHYRWNKNQEHYIYGEFGKTVFPSLPAFIQRFIGKKVGAKFRGFVELLGITEQSIPAIEDWYENDFLIHLNEHFKQHNYLLGDKACIGDFGLMGPLYAHLYLDPVPGALMKEKAPFVVKWIERMNTTKPAIGQWHGNDDIPTTLLPILSRMMQEFIPVMQSTVSEVAKFKDTSSSTQLPRRIGEHSFTLGKVEEKRLVLPFSQWKFQRVLDSLPTSPDEQQQLSDFLAKISGQTILNTKITHRVTRVNNQLVWA